MASELVRLLKPVEAMMRWFDAGVHAAIIGGVAASLLGKPRLTKDIDAVVLDAEAEALIASGAPFGFLPRIADAVDFARSTRMLLLCFTEGAIDIDLSLGALPFEYEVIDRSKNPSRTATAVTSSRWRKSNPLCRRTEARRSQ